jgi:hypothetical protein
MVGNVSVGASVAVAVAVGVRIGNPSAPMSRVVYGTHAVGKVSMIVSVAVGRSAVGTMVEGASVAVTVPFKMGKDSEKVALGVTDPVL